MITKLGLYTAAAALALFAAGPATAGAQGGGLALKGGLSYGNVSNGGLLPGQSGSRTGFAAGISATSGGMLALGIEALYAQRGVTSRRLDYIDVPVYVRVALPVEQIQPFAYVGPQASYELKCGSDGIACPRAGRDRVTYAGVIGAGVRLGHAVSLEGRYVYGLRDLRLNTITTSESYKTRSFMLLLAMGF